MPTHTTVRLTRDSPNPDGNSRSDGKWHEFARRTAATNAMPSPAATWLARNESFPLKVVRLLVVGAAPIAAALPALVDAAGT